MINGYFLKIYDSDTKVEIKYDEVVVRAGEIIGCRKFTETGNTYYPVWSHESLRDDLSKNLDIKLICRQHNVAK